MKNIYLIPTSQPSRLVKFFTNKFHLCKEILPIQDEEQYQNIYITNDEEIKEGDWVFNFEYNYIVQYNSEKHDNKFWYKKIILTTDQDLIKDGVQAIDDTFLEWFVNNPSCEHVSVQKRYSDFTVEPFVGYKIIIPQEKLKQETLEEAADYYSSNPLFRTESPRQDIKRGFELGVKWQQEQDKNKYSEEEVLDIINSFEKLCYTYQSNKDWFPAKKSEWFEKFKKK